MNFEAVQHTQKKRVYKENSLEEKKEIKIDHSFFFFVLRNRVYMEIFEGLTSILWLDNRLVVKRF